MITKSTTKKKADYVTALDRKINHFKQSCNDAACVAVVDEEYQKILFDMKSGSSIGAIKDSIQFLSMLLMKNATLDRYLVMYGKDNFYPIFKKYQDLLDDSTYWKTLARVYVTSDNTFDYTADYKKMFSSTRSNREMLMNEEEQKFYNKLPDIISVYRSVSAEEVRSDNWGISWTLDEKVADRFTNAIPATLVEKFSLDPNDPKFNHKTTIMLNVNKSDTIAYFNGRNEEEIILLKPGKILHF